MQCKSGMKLFLFAALAALSYGVQADECKTIQLMQSFDVDQVFGVWYTQLVGPPNTSKYGDCMYFNVTGSNDITTKGQKLANGEYVKSDLKIVQEGNTSKLVYKPDGTQIIDNWWVDTDYKSWAVYYMCGKDNGQGTVFASTRKRIPGACTTRKLLASLRKYGFSTAQADLMIIHQNDCTN